MTDIIQFKRINKLSDVCRKQIKGKNDIQQQNNL